MNKPNESKPFDVLSAPLKGSNLIEASAGTGKTFSIAVLALRFLVEEGLSTAQLLMVTFTKAAVAELQTRIRKFIRQAHDFHAAGKEVESQIMDVVKSAVALHGEALIEQRLRDALLLLDELNVLTIHSFCQQTLNEFALETNQLFGAEMIADLRPIIEEELNKVYRRQVTTLPVRMLQQLWTADLKNSMLNTISKHLSGKGYEGFESNADYQWVEGEAEQMIAKAVEMEEGIQLHHEGMLQYVQDERAYLEECCGSGHAKKALFHLLDLPEDFIETFRSKLNTKYAQSITAMADLCAANDLLVEEHKLYVAQITTRLFKLVIAEVTETLQARKLRNNLLSYDDMIGNLHQALCQQSNTSLVKKLQDKYKAVFIDEFQDTDRKQYEIFHEAFGNSSTILFYIGDPKQSIYAFRSADIFTYLKARNTVDTIYEMNSNFRSSPRMIAAMNAFFLPTDNFDAFAFAEEEDGIRYISVQAPSNKDLPKNIPPQELPSTFLSKDPSEGVIRVVNSKNKEAAFEALSLQVATLLTDPNLKILEEGPRPIRPSDIGILVSSHKNAHAIKDLLTKLGIPSIAVDDCKVLETAAAEEMLHLLEAFEKPSVGTIHKALVSSLIQYSSRQLLQLDEEAALHAFTKYQSSWQEKGVYKALRDFATDFRLQEQLLLRKEERLLTNFIHLSELIHRQQQWQRHSNADLLSWLRRAIQGQVVAGDEFEQRIERDEEAIQIATIHVSKGLEYNIVFAPNLDLEPKIDTDLYDFRDPNTGTYHCTEAIRATEDQRKWYFDQKTQENRRLLYVALTRAKSKTYIFASDFYKSKDTALRPFLNEMDQQKVLGLIDRDAPVADKPEIAYRPEKSAQLPANTTVKNFSLLHPNWQKLSFTRISAPHAPRRLPMASEQNQVYDTFIFQTLKRGKDTGDMLHYIFENIRFNDSKGWSRVVNRAITRYATGREEAYAPMLLTMVNTVTKVMVRIGEDTFRLSDIENHKMIAEMEFDFTVPTFAYQDLNLLSNENASLAVKSRIGSSFQEAEGVFNGKMDLFFEVNGKYYILDYKSNYLGDSLGDYDISSMHEAMNDNNYHLQYLLYSLAAKKYLQSRIADFNYQKQFGGVIYLFVRGIRDGASTGIYTTIPSFEIIKQLEQKLNLPNSV